MHCMARALAVFWEENDPSEMQHCEWRASIIAVARSQLSSSQATIDIVINYITFAHKASMWLVDAMSTFEASSLSKDSSIHSIFELQLELFTFICQLAANITDCTELTNGPLVSEVEIFVKDSFNLVKLFCLRDKMLQNLRENLLRVGQELISRIVKLVIVYRKRVCASATNNETLLVPFSTSRDNEKLLALTLDGSSIVKSAVENLTELGSICVSNVGTAIGLFNVSWKGITALLQSDVGQRVLASFIDVSKIIEILISHALQFIRQGAETGLMQQSDVSSKNFWISSKFFLYHALKIACCYPCEAFRVHKEIIGCASKVMGLLVTLPKDNLLLQELAETLNGTIAPISYALLCALLNANEINDRDKVQVIDALTADEGLEDPLDTEETSVHFAERNILYNIFVTTGTEMSRKLIAAGRLCMYLNLLQVSYGFSMDIAWELSKRLNWLLSSLSGEVLYVYLFQIRCISVTTEVSAKPSWQLMFVSIMQALKTFAIVTASSLEAWREIEGFLFLNALHPNAICRDLVLDLWYFILRHSTPDLVRSHSEALSLLFESISSRECYLSDSYRERMAKIISMIVKATPDTGLSWLIQLASGKNSFLSQLSIMAVSCVLQESLYSSYVYNGLVKQGNSQFLTSYVDTARLLAELSEAKFASNLNAQKMNVNRLLEVLPGCENKQIAQRIIDLTVDGIRFDLLDLKENLEHDFINTILKVLALVLDVRLNAKGDNFRDRWTSLMDHLIQAAKHVKADKFKPTLACLLAVLSEIPFLGGEYDAVSELYHEALKERHWALVHAGLDSFGHFATRTSCSELWRFVPLDAALSHDTKTGSILNEEGFTDALRVFLEKELAQTSSAVTDVDLVQMLKECNLHRQVLIQTLDRINILELNVVDLDTHVESNSSSFEDARKAMQLLQEGFSVLREKFNFWLEDTNQYTQELDWFHVQIADFMDEITIFQKSKFQRLG
ncbi:hypothetical protein O6H91_20G000500 [Diphasiastrum complanatum]|nr:hypothetical protein O6H91_20G000500 [Diphasiastrum complanatum]